MTILYIVEENNFVPVVYKLLAQKKYLKCHNNDWFKINNTQRINMPKKVNMTHLRILKGKQNCHL